MQAWLDGTLPPSQLNFFRVLLALEASRTEIMFRAWRRCVHHTLRVEYSLLREECLDMRRVGEEACGTLEGLAGGVAEQEASFAAYQGEMGALVCLTTNRY